MAQSYVPVRNSDTLMQSERSENSLGCHSSNIHLTHKSVSPIGITSHFVPDCDCTHKSSENSIASEECFSKVVGLAWRTLCALLRAQLINLKIMAIMAITP